jgi:hypothetical protein
LTWASSFQQRSWACTYAQCRQTTGRSSSCVVGRTIEALFIDPEDHRQGGGKLLVSHAQSFAAGELAVDVNEQNEAALRFYEALGCAGPRSGAVESCAREPSRALRSMCQQEPSGVAATRLGAIVARSSEESCARGVIAAAPSHGVHMETLAILAMLEAKPGKERDVEACSRRPRTYSWRHR